MALSALTLLPRRKCVKPFFATERRGVSKKGDQEALNKSEARYRSLVAQLIRSAADEQALADAERFRQLVVPSTRARVLTNIAERTKAGNWPRRRARRVWEPLYAHLTGGRPIGGVHADVTQVLVQDLDASSEISIRARLRVARLVQPRSLVLRSSDSGGIHVVSVFARPHPIRVVLHLAHERLRKAAAAVDHELYARVAAASLEGVDGLFELHPRPWPQGSVIRVPFGRGSWLVDDKLRPLHSTPGEGIRLLLQWLDATAPPAELHEAFPFDDIARLLLPPLATTLMRRTRPARETKTSGEYSASLNLLAHCDGRVEVGERGTMADCRKYASSVANHGLPDASTRNASTFALAYVAIAGDGLDPDTAHKQIWSILQRCAGRSKDVRRRPVPTEARTKKIIEGYYKRHLGRGRAENGAQRPFRVIQGGQRYREPKPIHLSDWVHTLDLFGGDGHQSGTWLRILRFTRANRYEVTSGSGYWVSPLPLEKLGLRGPRGQKALKTFIRMGLLVPYKPAVPKARRNGVGPWRNLRAAEYRVRWRFLAIGREVLSPQPVSSLVASRSRAKVQAVSSQLGEMAQQFVNPRGLSAPVSVPVAVGAVGGSRESALAGAQLWERRPGGVSVDGHPVQALHHHPCEARGAGRTYEKHARSVPDEPFGAKLLPRGPYVDAILGRWREISGCPNRRGDHAQAERFWREGLPAELVEAGICLAELRRRRAPDETPHPRVNSLAYYIPAIREVQEERNPAGLAEYCAYLRRKMTAPVLEVLTLMRPSGQRPSRRVYERRVIDLYLGLPGTPARAGKADWKEARNYYRQGVPLEAVEAGIVEALARRLLRQVPLPGRVRSLHYFRGPITEAIRNEPDSGRIADLQRRLEALRRG